MSELADTVSRQIAALDADRLPWEGLWQELAEVCHPRRNTIQQGFNPRPPAWGGDEDRTGMSEIT